MYLDTCVLRLAYEGQEDDVSKRAMEELNREDATFLYSRISELELLPNPTRNKRASEVEYFTTYFQSAEYVECTQESMRVALEDACRVGMAAADALHVGCAATGNADELVTAESVDKALPKATVVTVRSIR